MKTPVTILLSLIIGLGSSIASAAAQMLEPGQTLLAAHYGSDSYAALSNSAGFSSANASSDIPRIGPGFNPPRENPLAPGYGPSGPGQGNSPAERPWADTPPHDSDSTGKGALPLPATGIGTMPMMPRTTAGDAANNSVLYSPIPSGQYSFGFGKTSGGGGGGPRNPGSAYEGRLPPTSTSSIDFDIVDR